MDEKRIMSLALAFFFLFSGCSLGKETDTAAENNKTQATSIADQQLAFALECFRKTLDGAEKEENAVISPFGVYRMLGTLCLGSEGKTKNEIAATMGRTGDDAAWIEQMAAVCKRLGQTEEVRLAGGVWIQNDYAIEPQFIEQLWSVSAQEVQKTDFSVAEAKETVNRWFKQKTDGRVPELLKEVSPETRLLLADAVTFRGEWKRAFDPKETRNGYFTDGQGKEVRYPMMEQEATFPYYKGEGFQYLEMPYKNDRCSMAVILPEKWDRYRSVEKELTSWKLAELRTKAEETEVSVRFPKFSLERNINLAETLRKMGIVEAFGTAAEFRPLAAGNELRLEQVAQGTFLKVEEKGTQAAAGTAAAFTLKSAPAKDIPLFYADRPFLYWIRDNTDGTILFFGRMIDPASMAEASEAAAANEPSEPQVEIVSEGGTPTAEASADTSGTANSEGKENKEKKEEKRGLHNAGDGGEME